MRPTQLNFRSPVERTAEYNVHQITKTGQSLDFKMKNKNKTKSNLPKDTRFKEVPLYCKGTGASCFLGPGSYNDQESFLKLKASACPTLMKRISNLPKGESGEQQYIMVGNQIKYEPAWVTRPHTKQSIRATKAQECLSSISAGLTSQSMSHLKNNLRTSQKSAASMFHQFPEQEIPMTNNLTSAPLEKEANHDDQFQSLTNLDNEDTNQRLIDGDLIDQDRTASADKDIRGKASNQSKRILREIYSASTQLQLAKERKRELENMAQMNSRSNAHQLRNQSDILDNKKSKSVVLSEIAETQPGGVYTGRKMAYASYIPRSTTTSNQPKKRRLKSEVINEQKTQNYEIVVQENGRFGNQSRKVIGGKQRKAEIIRHSMLPKTAFNYYNLRKGLYLKKNHPNSLASFFNTTSGYDEASTAAEKSLKMLNAYGEIQNTLAGPLAAKHHIVKTNQSPLASQGTHAPLISNPNSEQINKTHGFSSSVQDIRHQFQKAGGPQSTRAQKRVNRKRNVPVVEAALSSNSTYMNIIRESHASVMRRKHFEQEKRRILDMDFDVVKDKMAMHHLNQFISDKQSDASMVSNLETRDSRHGTATRQGQGDGGSASNNVFSSPNDSIRGQRAVTSYADVERSASMAADMKHQLRISVDNQ